MGNETLPKIIAVCKSKKKGTKKEAIAGGVLREDYGLIGDAHADCCTPRQVSLLAIEGINKMRNLGFDVGPGDFAENLTTEGIDLVSLPVGTHVSIGKEAILEVTQVGKECHSGCAIRRQIGKCIMPKEGVFAQVIRGGSVRAGDTIRVMARDERMREETEKLSILRVTEQGRSRLEDVVVREFSLTIILNNQELVTLLCSPINLNYLAVGFLLSEGLIKDKEDIKKIVVDDQRGVVQVEAKKDSGLASQPSFKQLVTSGGGRGAPYRHAPDAQGQAKVESDIEISAREVFALMDEFVLRSEVFRATGGVHSAALCNTKSILVFSEDIGRHNAIDKIFGECILKDIPTEGHLIITSGRVSSEILLKVAKRNIPLLVSKAAPTNLGVRLASDLGVTLIGFARGRKMNLYTNEWRLKAK